MCIGDVCVCAHARVSDFLMHSSHITFNSHTPKPSALTFDITNHQPTRIFPRFPPRLIT